MMTELDILHQMIQEQAKIPLETDSYGNLFVTLIESQCPDSSVLIKHMPEHAIIISVDDFWSLERMFTHEKGQCKRADYVIIADTGIRRVIVYIEMKKAQAKERVIIEQLTGAQCFVAYCRGLAQAPAFWNQRGFLQEYEEYFVCLRQTGTGINKRTTRIAPERGNHNRPEKMLKINAPHYLTLQRLIGSKL